MILHRARFAGGGDKRGGFSEKWRDLPLASEWGTYQTVMSRCLGFQGIDSGLGGVPRELTMRKGHLPRVIHHLTKIKVLKPSKILPASLGRGGKDLVVAPTQIQVSPSVRVYEDKSHLPRLISLGILVYED